MYKASTTAAKIKRERFAHEWLKDRNATAAYKRAGYAASGNGAQVNAGKLLKHPDVQAIIQKAQAQIIKKIDITTERVLQEAAVVAFATPADAPKHADKGRMLELLAKYLGLTKDQPPPPQWNLDPATLGKMSTEDLEQALKHAEMVQNLLAGKTPTP